MCVLVCGGVSGLGYDVAVMLDLNLVSARLVRAGPEKSPVQSVQDLAGMRIATEFPGICKKFFAEAGVDVTLIEVSGACEAAPQLGVADAIVDLTSSGTTLEINKLRIVSEILSSTTNVIANHESLATKHEKIEEILLAFESVIAAKGQCYLMLNVDTSKLDDVRSLIPGLGGPTIMDIAGSGAVAVHAVVPHVRVYQLINQLKRAGARDILVLDITRMVR